MKFIKSKTVLTISLAAAFVVTGVGVVGSVSKPNVANATASIHSNEVIDTGSGHYVTVDKNVRLYVEDVGKGKPVVFLHGWPFNHEMFEYQQNTLPAKGVRFIGIDLRGFGKSDHTYDGNNMETYADDVRAVIEKLNLKDATLVGFSMGSTVATEYGIKYQDNRVSKLILTAAPTPKWGIPQEAVDSLVAGLVQDRPQTLAVGEGTFVSKTSKEYLAWLGQLELEADSHTTIESIKSVAATDLSGELDQIKVPTLILHGVQDTTVPFAVAEKLHKGIKNSTLVPFENSGHGLFHDEKDKYNEEIIHFVRP
ncbi:pimeloyl-ACP methyl ester carboxylesterase [Paenibacillus rhizosphaerae]|uniref:Pimeloyl-ACP methyl ester carboxylesterase n=1 Tax=Paenibacillus rhizosphaerae TaxID=297318 RepID=A0A839TWM9_9BACL|nr:alpha/beta hydrolase [Paenibacillus rhizosphaerae]MBB3129077.1 pimeloyl-ACP methyl ester carboxylesterase [Paenibacillus rhizosphaerae]